MKKLLRFGVSMEGDLLEKFDHLISKRGYTNRSEAIRDIVRGQLVEETVKTGSAVTFGVISYVYDHHKHELEKILTDFQHHHYKNIITSTHVHIDHDNCLETVIMKGKPRDLQQIADTLLSFKGVKHGKLTMTSSLV